MRTFKDTNGTEWQVAINTTTLSRVRSVCQLDLLDIADGKLIQRLLTDPILLVNVLYVVCLDQAEERGQTDEDFGRAMAGDAIDKATGVLLEEITDFFRSPKLRENIRRVVKAILKAEDRALDLVAERLEAGELDKLIEQALANAGSSSGSAPESPASIPAP